ncbi:MAG: TonB-dependent receptor [Prevotella sp.]|nr:TonB-dependent receptor [Prevotella sp.]MBQ8488059.1 TonB-dependent receptor [Prevotella sp.]
MEMLGVALLLAVLQGDSIVEKAQNLDEVVISSAAGHGQKRSAKGQVASIDEHLSVLRGVNLVRRGSYAWEPVVNNMQMERLSTTIDGMKIFYACTDKMDPVTSYVESGNLQSISLSSGLDGNPQATGNIGGSLDLRLRKTGFDAEPLHVGATAGHEWNGHVQVYGADAALSGHRLYTNFGAFYRHADNYRAGGGDELPLLRPFGSKRTELEHSQFQKVNAFANAGARLTERDMLEATLIFDRATDVGYPALNMDVARAEAVITSLAYKHLFTAASWETKLYYNHITHEMDDTHRPDVQIHMDMPGHSQTAGLYSLLTTGWRQHDVSANCDLYYNRLLADMTMYPGGAAPMYMVTWPDVGTLCTGLALSDNLTLTDSQRLHLSAKLSWQTQRLNSDEGYHALKVFFPTMTNRYHQATARLAASYQLTIQNSQVAIGAGWGSRAPTVTEAYSYYLNNTFDQYDYIGNPSLKNESAVELNAAVSLSLSHGISLRADANAFFFSNYIIGQFETRLSPMTVGAEGVKVYGNISHATIVNTALTAEWQLTDRLCWKAGAAYALGHDADGDPLPLIAPLTWNTDLDYQLSALHLQLALRGNARQVDYGAKYGETETSGWTVCNASVEYDAYHWLTLRGGVENLLDRRYTSYADWNGIPQKGRNIYMNLTFKW